MGDAMGIAKPADEDQKDEVKAVRVGGTEAGGEGEAKGKGKSYGDDEDEDDIDYRYLDDVKQNIFIYLNVRSICVLIVKMNLY